MKNLNFIVLVVTRVKFSFELHGCFAACFSQGYEFIVLRLIFFWSTITRRVAVLEKQICKWY